MSSHITLLVTLRPGSSPPLPALRLLPLLDGPGACEDSGVPCPGPHQGGAHALSPSSGNR